MTRTLLAAVLCAAPLAAAPVPKADADVDKLLARVRIDNVGSALSQPAVASAVGLDDVQSKKVETLADTLAGRAKATAAAARQRGNNGAEDQLTALGTLLDLGREFDDEVVKLLTPEQARRLKQVQLQKEGPAGLLSRHAVRALDLTAEQEDQLAAELAKAKKLPMLEEVVAMTCGAAGAGNGEVAGMQQMLAKYAVGVDAVQEAMLKVLTKEQRATWAKMTGDPLPRTDLIKAGTAFGDAKLTKAFSEGEAVAAPNAVPPPAPPAAPPPAEEKE